MKASILVWASIFFAPVARSQPVAVPSQAESFRILSWNIYMLPGFLGEGKIPRARSIGSLLASGDYDVIVFQEAFHHQARKTISRLLKPAFPFQEGPANRKTFSLKTNSGLWIVSRYPILAAYAIKFKTRRGIDALSRKGALLVELQVGQQTVQVIGTHLQNSGSDWLRHSQCVELYHRLLRPYQKPGVPQIVCGDFNIDRYEEESNYKFMLQTLDARDADSDTEPHYTYDRVANDLHVEAGNGKDLIDYILVRPNEGYVKATPRVRVFQQRWNSRHRDLSDHYSIETEILFSDFQSVLTASAPNPR